jgi:hypothetical protein
LSKCRRRLAASRSRSIIFISCRRVLQSPDYSITVLHSLGAPPSPPGAPTVRITHSSVRHRRLDVSQRRCLSPVTGLQDTGRGCPTRTCQRSSARQRHRDSLLFSNMRTRGSECSRQPTFSACRLPPLRASRGPVAMWESNGHCWKLCPAYLRLRLFPLQ